MRGLGDDERSSPEILASLDRAALSDLGQDYVERTRVHRQTDKPYFIDKMRPIGPTLVSFA